MAWGEPHLQLCHGLLGPALRPNHLQLHGMERDPGPGNATVLHTPLTAAHTDVCQAFRPRGPAHEQGPHLSSDLSPKGSPVPRVVIQEQTALGILLSPPAQEAALW